MQRNNIDYDFIISIFLRFMRIKTITHNILLSIFQKEGGQGPPTLANSTPISHCIYILTTTECIIYLFSIFLL